MPIVTVQQSPRAIEQKRTDHENWAKAGTLAADR
jgi:hypothetical protein